jgi:hypothetical protein
MTTIAVKETKNQWQDPFFSLFVDDEQSAFTHYGSRKLTNTCSEDGNGIFNTENCTVRFKRKDTWVTVDFGLSWDAKNYKDPALEIKHRIHYVEEAFEAVSESYENVWTVNLDDDNSGYVEKRIKEAAQATHYNDGLLQYKIDDYLVDDEDENGNDCFRVISADGYDDTHLIAFCDIPQEAYFLKLTRID